MTKYNFREVDLIYYEGKKQLRDLITLFIIMSNSKENRRKIKRKINKVIKELGCWGFAEHDSKKIYIWIDKDKITLGSLLELISHEIGHVQKPFHFSNENKEERKADLYMEVACVAFDLANDIITKTHNKQIVY